MPTRRRATGTLKVLVSTGVVSFAKLASAQAVDVSPPLPNVMILLDNSGSMEKMVDGRDPEAVTGAACVPGVQSLPNRWGSATQALTGDVQPYYSCLAMPRTAGGAFDNEYAINNTSPYDVNYHLPFHRSISNGSCVVAPGALPGASPGTGVGRVSPQGAGGSALDFPATAIVTRTYDTSVACQFNQIDNGALDGARDLLRFGFMTFDTDTSPGTGVTPGSVPQVLTAPANPFTGQWSYYPNWDTGSSLLSAGGHPFGCLTGDTQIEVGARNPAAPPWEGRLIGFPIPDATIAQVQSQNDSIQLAINALRPYGATPIAGLLRDAKQYFWVDSNGPQLKDGYVQGGCRDEYIILITDGAPNLDLRPTCAPEGAAPAGHCPFPRSEDTTGDLAAGSDGTVSGHKIFTYVIGYAVSQIDDGSTPIECKDLAANQTLFDATCSNPAKQDKFGPCCTLQKLAASGGTGLAYFANSQQDLTGALTDIIGKIGRKVTTRTTPSFSPVVADVTNNPGQPITNASTYYSSFAPLSGSTWQGDINRTRYVCDSSQQITVQSDPNSGDDFGENLNNGTGGTYSTRKFIVVPPLGVGDPTRTIRMNTPIGLETVSPTLYTAAGPQSGPTDTAAAVAALTPDNLKITATSCPNSNSTQFLSKSQCRDLALDFTFGAPTMPSPMPAGFAPFQSRVKNALGDIFHATPLVVGPPGALIRDESYNQFRSLHSTRPTVLYAATNDGLLHAFDTNVTAKESNEIWAFLPPAVMPALPSIYPRGHQLLLDGAPVVRDTVWSRSLSDIGDATKWHTTLVAGFGRGSRGYYAMDVTDPARPVGSNPGPKFLWQNTITDTGTKQIFGQNSGTPAIATVFVDLNDGNGKREIGVALLPGGSENGPIAGQACARAVNASASNAAPLTSLGYNGRDKVRCWAAPGQPVVGRSFSVVRLDTGEIIRTFMRATDAPVGYHVIDTPLDSPMTGVPVVYPTQVGAIAQRAFIGDADGTMWRFDFSSTNPDSWKGELFFDTVNQHVADTSAGSTSWNDGQPIQIAPAIALDRFGNVVVEVGSGDQESYTAAGTNYVYSITEVLGGAVPRLRAQPNWYLQFSAGERVSGPMAVFDGVLYFATFQPTSTIQSCSAGTPKLWGRDFTVPEDTLDLSKGGVRRFNPTSAIPAPAFYDPGYPGKIIPGVSINITPTCSDTSFSSADPYVPGATHYEARNINAGTPSLVAQVGTQDVTGKIKTIQVALPQKVTPTSIDSWAAVVE